MNKGILSTINLSQIESKYKRKNSASSSKFRQTHSRSFIKSIENPILRSEADYHHNRAIPNQNYSTLLDIVQNELDLSKSKNNLQVYCEQKRNHDKYDIMKISYEDYIKNLKSGHSEMLYNIKNDYESQIDHLKINYEEELRKLNEINSNIKRELNIKLNDQKNELYIMIEKKDLEAKLMVKDQENKDKIILETEKKTLIEVIERERRNKLSEIDLEVEKRLDSTMIALEDRESSYKKLLKQHKDEEINLLKIDYEKSIEELKYEVTDLNREITVMKIEYAKQMQVKKGTDRFVNELNDQIYKYELVNEELKSRIKELNEQIEQLTIRNNDLYDVLDAIKKRENYVDKHVDTFINSSNIHQHFAYGYDNNTDELDKTYDKVSTLTDNSSYRDHRVINKLDDKMKGYTINAKGTIKKVDSDSSLNQRQYSNDYQREYVDLEKIRSKYNLSATSEDQVEFDRFEIYK